MSDVIPTDENVSPTIASELISGLLNADQAEMVRRLAGVGNLPPSWFGAGATEVDDQSATPGAPILTTLLSGGAYNLAWVYVLYTYALTQSRLATMTGVWLDRFSYDFFGIHLPRRSGERDSQYRQRIYLELFRPRQTRAAITQAVTDLTGNTPQIMEMWNPQDCGGYDEPAACGYGLAGSYGDLSLRNQVFITAFRPSGGGVANISGYDNGGGCYASAQQKNAIQPAFMSFGFAAMSPLGRSVGGGNLEYIDNSYIVVNATDEEIYSAVSRVVAAGITAWVAIFSKENLSGAPQFYFGRVENSQYLPLISSFYF